MSRFGSRGGPSRPGPTEGLAEEDPSILRLGSSGDHTWPRYTSREVLSMLGVKQREVRQWLGEPLLAPIPAASRSVESTPVATHHAQVNAIQPEAAVEAPPVDRQRAHTAARYSYNDVQLLRSAQELRRNEVPDRRIRAAFASLKRRLPPGNSPLALRLIGHGKKVIIRDDDGTWDAESGQQMFDFASTHSLWPLDVAIPESSASGELDYSHPADPGPVPLNVLAFEDRRSRDFGAREWYQKARELELAGESGAVAAYNDALRLDPELVDAQIDLGRLLHERGDLHQARVHYALALETDATSATAHFNLAVVLEDLGQHERAVQRYTQTLLTDPMYSDAYYNLARLYEIRGERAAALRCLQSYRRVTRD